MRNYDRNAYHILLILIATLYSLVSYYTPLQFDDLSFLNAYNRTLNPDGSFAIRPWIERILQFRMEDNFRISNIVMPFFGAIAPLYHLFPIITGVLLACIISMGLKLSRIESGKFIPASVFWALMVLFLPWRNSIFVMDYTLNYIFASALTLLLLISLLKFEDKNSSRGVFLTLVLAVFAGGWHEGFALTTIAGLAVWALIRKFRMSKTWYLICAVYLVSTIAFGYSPGTFRRSVFELSCPRSIGFIKLFADTCISFTTIAVILIMSLKKRWRQRIAASFSNPAFSVLITACLLGVMISLIVHHTPRTSFWPNLCSIICLIILFKPELERLSKSRAGHITAIALTTVLLLQTVHVIFWQRKFHIENDDIIRAFDETGSKTVFYDITMPEDVPLTTLYIPARIAWVEVFHYMCLQWFRNEENLAVVPTDLKNAGQRNDILIPGNANARRNGSAIWVPYTDSIFRNRETTFDVKLRDGATIKSAPAYIGRFPLSDGDSALYVKPYKISTDDIVAIDVAGHARE